MANDSTSEGSDLEVENSVESESDEEVPADPIIRDQWVNMMFDSDSDEDDE